MTDTQLIEQALRIATVAHLGQMRKGDGLPYIVHPVAVGFKLSAYHFPTTVVVAGILHDVVEDTSVTLDELRLAVGSEVATIVDYVSHREVATDTWRISRSRYLERILTGPEGAWAVAIADKIHNSDSLVAAHQKLGSAVFEKFYWDWDEKIWFEQEVLHQIAAVWRHPILEEYAISLEKFLKLADAVRRQPQAREV